jgi:transposase
MAQTVCIIVSPADRERLRAIAADSNKQRKHVERAQIVLASAERGPVLQIAAQPGVSRPMVWRWQQRWTFHFTPTSSSWLNAVENFFSVLTRKRIRRGSFHSIVDLQAAINRYLEEHNTDPRPFVWTASAASIRAKLDRLPASSD